MKLLQILSPLVPLFALTSHASATSYIINVNAADAEVTNSTNPISDAGAGSGVSNATKNGPLLSGAFNGLGISPVFAFALPTIPMGETISSVTLSFTAARFNTTGFNGDLYGLAFRSSANAVANDYFTGTLDPTNATLLQDDILNNTGAIATTTSAGGNTALISYLNSQYVNGAVGGDFVLLRFSADFTSLPSGTGSRGYALSSSETGNGMTLTVNTVPEPSAISLFGLCGASLLVRRRR